MIDPIEESASLHHLALSVAETPFVESKNTRNNCYYFYGPGIDIAIENNRNGT